MKTADRFVDRSVAGQALAAMLAERALVDPIVLAMPRGGVPVALEVANRLHAPLDLVLVRKIGVPYQPELAAGAVVDGGEPEIVVNADVLAATGMTRADIEDLANIELAEIERRRRVYLSGRAPQRLKGRTVIVVDDGIATGASIRAALAALRRKQPKRLILAVPVAPAETIERLQADVDEIVCLKTPEPFYAIGLHYEDFHQVPDDEVIRSLQLAQSRADRTADPPRTQDGADGG